MENYRHKDLPPVAIAALLDASAAINSSLELAETMAAIARSAAAVLRAEASSVIMLDPHREKLVFLAAVGDRSESLLGEEFDAGLGIAGRVASSGQPALVNDVSHDRHFFKGIDEKIAFHTQGLICAPLKRRNTVIGVVEVLNKVDGTAFKEEDMELLQVFANLAVFAADNARNFDELKRENRGFRETLRDTGHIIGTSSAMQEVMSLCNRVATSNSTVLLLGETGTGKELIARNIHFSSPRNDKPFVAINCAALPEGLLESELFGHEAGSFTGATSQKLGRFELADGGTLFLDEIGDISGSIQVKLLRVLQEKEIVRVGGTKTISTDVRILAATNRDLRKAMEEGRFREDLYYRLNVFPINIPPLRQRNEDIPLLIDYYVKKLSTNMNCAAPQVTLETVALMSRYSWPGNIRELQNVLERACLLADGVAIQPSHMPRELVGDSAELLVPEGGDRSLWGYEKALIVNALRECNWNQTKAAKSLSISRDNIRYRIKKFNIQKP